jgi:hypothetical protein
MLWRPPGLSSTVRGNLGNSALSQILPHGSGAFIRIWWTYGAPLPITVDKSASHHLSQNDIEGDERPVKTNVLGLAVGSVALVRQ